MMDLHNEKTILVTASPTPVRIANGLLVFSVNYVVHDKLLRAAVVPLRNIFISKFANHQIFV